MKVIIFVCLMVSLFILPKQLHSQSCINWQQIIGGAEDERGMDIVFDEITNTYWACGYVTTTADSTNVLSKNGWLANFNNQGLLLNQFEIKDTADIIAKQIVTADSILLFATTVLLNDTIPPHTRLYAASKNGFIKWQVNKYEPGEINALALSNLNEIVVAGYIEDTITFDENVLVEKYSLDGNLLWSQTYGGSKKERLNDLFIKDDTIILCGFSLSTDGDISNNIGSRDVWLLQLNTTSGNLIKEKNFGGTSAESAVGLTQTNNNEIVILAETLSDNGDVTSSFGNGDFWAFKIDEDWDIVWQKTFGGGSIENPKTIAAFTNGNVLIGGVTLSFDNDIKENFGFFDTWLARLNGETGDLVWSKSIGGNDLDFTAQININNADEIVIIGNTDSNSIGCKSECENPHEFQNIWLYSVNEDVILDVKTTNSILPSAVKVFCVDGWVRLTNASNKIKQFKIYDVNGLEYESYNLMPYEEKRVFVEGLREELVLIVSQ